MQCLVTLAVCCFVMSLKPVACRTAWLQPDIAHLLSGAHGRKNAVCVWSRTRRLECPLLSVRCFGALVTERSWSIVVHPPPACLQPRVNRTRLKVRWCFGSFRCFGVLIASLIPSPLRCSSRIDTFGVPRMMLAR